jgi:hypothetical protein
VRRWLAAVVVLLLVACGSPSDQGPAAEETGQPSGRAMPAATEPAREPAEAPAPEPAPTPSPSTAGPSAVGGAPSGTCVNGWATPDPGTELATFPLETLRTYLGLGSVDELVVDTVRYFTGPEDVEVVEPRTQVERWYVEAILVSEPAPAGRWMIRRTAVGSGVVADAPYGTTGFGPGLWWSSDAGGYDPFDPPCTAAHGPYCPCAWGVGGCSCDDPAQPACTGPPPEVMGCLDGL